MKNSKFIFFTFLIIGCSDSSVEERWADGTVKTKCFVVGNTKCYEYFSETNRLIEEGCFLGEEKNGKWITYHENGKVKTTSYYQHGKLGGEYVRYSKGGNIEEETLYIDGFAEEKMKATENQSFQLTKEVLVMKEVIVDKKRTKKYREFYDDGALKAIGYMRKGKKSGIWKYFHPDGTLWASGKYLPKIINDNVEVGPRVLDFIEEERYIRTGKWNFYNPQKELTCQLIFRFVNNKYTCKVIFEQDNKEL